MAGTPDPPPYSLTGDRKTRPFAEVAKPVWENPIFREVLRSFRVFLSNQEAAKTTKDQLELFRALSVLVLETSIKSINDGEDVADVLAASTDILNTVSTRLETARVLNDTIQNPSQLSNIESEIREAFEGLETQLRTLVRLGELETNMYKDELIQAQQRDRAKIQELETIVKQMAPQSAGSFDTMVEKSIEEQLKTIRDPTVGQEQVDAKRSLAIIAELTGESLPPSTILGKEFVTIGHEIHQGINYDVFVGEYFTGERIAVKKLRHHVDEETAQKMHERFARQALNWSSLRYDSILPFYGIGVVPSPVVEGNFQLYMVSPYLQNQDARRYLKRYPGAPLKARLQMAQDVARGLRHMHEAAELPEPGNGIVHSALNIFNVLVKDSGRAAISGFGSSKVIIDFQKSFTGDNAEYRYMAPEMMTDEPHITYGTDIWSWAMTALEILTDVPAFGEKTKGPKIIQMITLGKQPNRADHPKLEEYTCADDLWSLFEECWEHDAAARPTADKVVLRLRQTLQVLGTEIRGGEHVQDLVQEPYQTSPRFPETARQDRLVAGRSQSLPVPPAGQGDLDKAVHPAEQTKSPAGIQDASVSPESGSQGLAWQIARLVGEATTSVMPPLLPQPDHRTPEPGHTPETYSISESTSIIRIVEDLIKHGCQNVTDNLDLCKCSEYPVSGGGFGDVYRGQLRDGPVVAIKCSRLYEKDIHDMDDNRRKTAKAAAHEVYVASKLRHKNIVGVIGVAHFRNQVAMVSPWMENGVITAYLNKTPGADRYATCIEVSEGLAYMHQNGIVHGDLKGDNVLVSHDGVAQITDFGNTTLAQYTLQFTAGQSKTRATSLRWAARELVVGGDAVKFTAASDIWALGMTILEIITGQWPFQDKAHDCQVILAISQGRLPSRPQDKIPRDSRDGSKLWELMTKCWTEDPAKRPNALEIGRTLETISQEGLTRSYKINKTRSFWRSVLCRGL